MSTYSNQVDFLVTSIEDVVNNLQSYVEAANNATTQDEYDKYYALYSSEKTSYDELKAELESANEDLVRYITFKKVSVSSQDIPNVKDPDEWRAGGTFRNETHPGGTAFGLKPPAISNQPEGIDKTVALLNGSFEFLNPGLQEIGELQNTFYTDFLKSDAKKVQVFSFTVAILISDVEITKITGEFEALVSDGFDITNENYLESGALAKAMQVKQILNTDVSVMDLASVGSLSILGKVTVILDIVDMLNNKNMTLETFAQGVAYQTGKALVSQMASSLVGGGILGMVVGFLAGAAFQEYTEMQYGVDRIFGPGGEMIAYDGTFKNVPAYAQGLFIGKLTWGDMASRMAGYGNWSTTITDASGRVVGTVDGWGDLEGNSGTITNTAYGSFGSGTLAWDTGIERTGLVGAIIGGTVTKTLSWDAYTGFNDFIGGNRTPYTKFYIESPISAPTATYIEDNDSYFDVKDNLVGTKPDEFVSEVINNPIDDGGGSTDDFGSWSSDYDDSDSGFDSDTGIGG